jgi:hypothetical protein
MRQLGDLSVKADERARMRRHGMPGDKGQEDLTPLWAGSQCQSIPTAHFRPKQKWEGKTDLAVNEYRLRRHNVGKGLRNWSLKGNPLIIDGHVSQLFDAVPRGAWGLRD